LTTTKSEDRTTNRLVYVAGPVNGTAFDESRARNHAIVAKLAEYGLVGVDPLDFENVDALSGHAGELDETAKHLGLTSDEQIVYGCLDKLSTCSSMLLCVPDKTYTVGTYCELADAWRMKRKVVAVLGPDVKSAWLNVLTERASNLDDACARIRAHVDAAERARETA
jgi:hypothetical protein